MPTPTSTARWRRQPVVPANYDDVAHLVALAREARERTVDFDFVFSRLDLLSLRRAAYEWGAPVRGRYKTFDAQVLAAINQALGDPDSLFSLTAPQNTAPTDHTVSCVPSEAGFRLFGHASFDVVFGYGIAGVDQNAPGSVHLQPFARQELAIAVGMLGWDLRLLQEERYRPVRNALYGLPLAYGVVASSAPSSQPTVDIPVRFHGPFSAINDGQNRCLFGDPLAASTGVYLWTVKVGEQLRPWYVGQTRRGFGQRMGEHLAAYLSGQYPTLDLAALSHGDNRRAAGSPTGLWPDTIPSFLRHFDALLPHVMGLIRLLRFHVAPLSGDPHLYDRVEGALGRFYKAHPEPQLRDFFAPGLRVPAAVPYDTRVRLILSSEAPLAGLPTDLLE